MKICSFTGHRKIELISDNEVRNRISKEVDELIKQGVTTFCSGGALGFDQICAEIIINYKKKGKQIELVLVLPCKGHDKYWSIKQKDELKKIINASDDIIYLQDKYSSDCMAQRNKKLVNMADVIICALQKEKSGTGQTVRMARYKGIDIINII